MNTTVFQNLSETWQTLIFIAIIVTSTLLGISISSLKNFSNELNEIIKDTKLTNDQKIHKLTLLSIQVNTQLGLAWESYNMDQAPTAETQDNAAVVSQISETVKSLEEELQGNYEEP
jgi:hypothetical protein